MRVIGTAGHVDHGKSTLVQALSGIDPDRLEEEKRRGMTIDLGFAWIDLPRQISVDAKAPSPPQPETEEVGIVDVPGHIDFIKNMLAGVGSIDAAVLVVAADEGVMPQTREHLAILDLLAVPATLIALTKIDLIDDDEWIDLIELDIVELLQTTRFADAPIVPVSARSGQGVDALRRQLASQLGELPPRRDRARPRLPIDRIFTLSGFGTIVTGTLSDGHFRVGDPVEIMPGGARGRIRGLQSHKRQIWQSEPGSRVAMNISGLSTDALRRGAVVVKPGTLQSTVLVDVSFRLLENAPKPLAHNQLVDFFSGAAEVPARVRLIGVEQLTPGADGWLQLRLERPLIVAAGDRFILRQPSPSVTIGGGVVLSPHPRRRWKRFDPAVIARLEILAAGAPDEILLQTLARHPLCTSQELFAHSGLDLELAGAAFEELCTDHALITLPMGQAQQLLTLGAWMRVTDSLQTILATHHRQSPLRRGLARGEARSRLQAQAGIGAISVRQFNAMVDEWIAADAIGADDSFLWKSEFSVTLTLQQQAIVDDLLSRFAAAPYAPPTAADTLRILGNDEELLEMLIEQGSIRRLPGGILFRSEDLEAMQTAVCEHIAATGSITLAATRDLFATSRKYVQALLEEMDRRHITRRDGDERVLRTPESRVG